MGLSAVILPTDNQPDLLQAGEHLWQRGEPDRVGVGHPLSLRLREGQAFLHGEGEPPAGREGLRHLLKQRLLLWKGKHLFGTPLGTLRLFAPDLVVALIATAVTGVLWAAFRLAVAYTNRSGPALRASPAARLRT